MTCFTQVSERKKRLNAVRAKTESKQKKVADLQVGLTLLAKDAAKVTSVENGDGEISTVSESAVLKVCALKTPGTALLFEGTKRVYKNN